MIKTLINYLYKKLNNNEYRVSLHGFNYEGNNCDTHFAIIYELYKDHHLFQETKDPYKSFLKITSNLSAVDYLLDNLDFLNKINTTKKETLSNFLKSNRDKNIVVKITQVGNLSQHNNLFILTYDGKWKKMNYRD